jgi:hypothetical protein
MRSSAWKLLAGALLLASGVVGQDVETETPAEDGEGDVSVASFGWFAPKWVTKYWQGSKYSCKCYPGDSCWPSNRDWQRLNTTVGGNLRVNLPPAAPCYNQFVGPLGTVNTYDAAKCADITANFANEQFQYVPFF